MNDPDELRAARRRVARLHHPDLGGDESVFVEAMERLRREGAAPVPPASGPSSPLHVVPTLRGRATRVVRRVRPVLDRVGRHLPARVPGARRYGRL